MGTIGTSETALLSWDGGCPKVGGDQVWAYNGDKASPTPPTAGWHVPWDGPEDRTLQLTYGGGAASGGNFGQRGPSPADEQKRREEEKRRAEERMKENQRREEDRKRREEEQKRQEAEEARRREQERQRREQDAIKRRENNAAQAVRKVIQRVRVATPETYDALRNEVEETQNQNL